MSKNRKYSCSDINMCLTGKIIAANLQSDLTVLSSIRSNWTPEYITDLDNKIELVIKTHLSVDKKKELRDATRILKELMEPAKKELSLFKAQLYSDYKSDKEKLEEYLRNLGLTKNLKAVQHGDQEALIELLFAFEKNMTNELKETFTTKGMMLGLIDNIIGFTKVINDANINQEFFKGTSKELSHEAVDELNAIYDEVMSICTISANHFKSNPVKKEQFTFSKIIANMGTTNKNNDEETE